MTAEVVFGLRNDNDNPIPVNRMSVGNLPAADKKIAAGYDDICFKRTLGDKGALLLVRLILERPRVIDGHQIGDKGGVALFDVFTNDKNLTSLEMGRNKLGPVSLKHCFEMLKVNETLTYLDLYKNKSLGETGGKLMGASLRVNTTLKGLCLNECNIPNAGMVALADGLAENKSLALLAAGGNQNNAEVAKAFADALIVNKTLKTLSLSGGGNKKKKVGNAGLKYIVDALKENNTLRKCILRKSNITDTGVIELSKVIAVNKSLTLIDLTKNKIGNKGYYSLFEAMKVNTTITALYLSHTSSPLLFQLSKLVARNEQANGVFGRTTFEDVLKDTHAKGPLNRSKLMLIGQGRAGKTATVRSLLGEAFDSTWKSTIAASVNVAKVSNATGWSKVEGSEKYKFAVDFAAKIALKDMDEHRKKVEATQNSDLAAAPISVGKDLNGNEEVMALDTEKAEDAAADKTAHIVDEDEEDEEDVENPIREMKMLRTQYHNRLYEDAELDRNSLKFTIWDFGGQQVFYSLHHLFMTKNAIYLLLFSMEELVENPVRGKGYIKFWLNSLRLHAPETPLLLVGSFKDKLKERAENIKTINATLKEMLKDYPFQIVENDGADLKFFPISNKNGAGVGEMKEKITVVAKSQEHTAMDLPLSWIYVLEHLLAKYKKPYITFSHFKEVAFKYKLKSDMEILRMLDTFSVLGLVLYLTQTTALKNIVVLKPQWLTSSFGRIIRDNELHKHNNKLIKKNALEEDIKHLFEDGLVSEEFLLTVWKEKEFDYLLDMMRQTLMLSDWKFSKSSVNNTEETYYFVPSLIASSKHLDQEQREDVTLKKSEFLINNEENLADICLFEFDFLPFGIYDRLICLAVGHANLLKVEMPPVASRGRIDINFGVKLAILQFPEDETLAVQVLEYKENAKASKALGIITSMLQKLKSDIIGEGLVWRQMFPISADKSLTLDEAVSKKKEPFFAAEAEKNKTDVSAISHIDVNKFLEGLQDF